MKTMHKGKKNLKNLLKYSVWFYEGSYSELTSCKYFASRDTWSFSRLYCACLLHVWSPSFSLSVKCTTQPEAEKHTGSVFCHLGRKATTCEHPDRISTLHALGIMQHPTGDLVKECLLQA